MAQKISTHFLEPGSVTTRLKSIALDGTDIEQQADITEGDNGNEV